MIHALKMRAGKSKRERHLVNACVFISSGLENMMECYTNVCVCLNEIGSFFSYITRSTIVMYAIFQTIDNVRRCVCVRRNNNQNLHISRKQSNTWVAREAKTEIILHFCTFRMENCILICWNSSPVFFFFFCLIQNCGTRNLFIAPPNQRAYVLAETSRFENAFQVPDACRWNCENHSIYWDRFGIRETIYGCMNACVCQLCGLWYGRGRNKQKPLKIMDGCMHKSA